MCRTKSKYSFRRRFGQQKLRDTGTATARVSKRPSHRSAACLRARRCTGLTCFDLADPPKPKRFVGDYVGKLFRKEELCALNAPHAARVWEYFVQVVGTFLREDVIARPPHYSRWRGASFELLLDAGQGVRL